MPESPAKTPQQGPVPAILNGLATLASILVVGVLVVLLAWRLPPPATHGGDTSKLEPPALTPCVGPAEGYLRGRLYGDLERRLDWSGRQLECDGMVRPDGGLRLLFAPAEGGLLFVVGIDAAAEAEAGHEVPVTLTVADEKSRRFYSSGNQQRCWVRLDPGLASGPEQTDQDTRPVAGLIFCSGALPAINSPGSITPGELRFRGRVSVPAP